MNNRTDDTTIWIFKTNIRYKKDVQKLAPFFNQLSGVLRWNVAIDDRDKILRIESSKLKAGDIITLVRQKGFSCEELPD